MTSYSKWTMNHIREDVMCLHGLGWSVSEIAKQLGVEESLVRKLEMDHFKKC